VLDRAAGGGVYQQLWHLDPGLTVRTVHAGYAVATAPGTELVIQQVALPGQVIPAGSTQVTRGQVNPYRGWVSRGQNQRTPAPVVTMTRYGDSASILTVIVPAAPGTAVSASAVAHGAGRYLLRIAIGQSRRHDQGVADRGRVIVSLRAGDCGCSMRSGDGGISLPDEVRLVRISQPARPSG
jgi:hypothetical protein